MQCRVPELRCQENGHDVRSRRLSFWRSRVAVRRLARRGEKISLHACFQRGTKEVVFNEYRRFSDKQCAYERVLALESSRRGL